MGSCTGSLPSVWVGIGVNDGAHALTSRASSHTAERGQGNACASAAGSGMRWACGLFAVTFSSPGHEQTQKTGFGYWPISTAPVGRYSPRRRAAVLPMLYCMASPAQPGGWPSVCHHSSQAEQLSSFRVPPGNATCCFLHASRRRSLTVPAPPFPPSKTATLAGGRWLDGWPGRQEKFWLA